VHDAPSYPLPQIIGGINSSREMAGSNLVRALDVIDVNGTLRTRKAWASVGAAPVVKRAAGLAYLAIGPDDESTATLQADRVFTQASLTVDESYVYIGSINRFDGFDWNFVYGAASAATTSRVLRLEYWNGSAWTQMPWLLDQTQGVPNGGTRRVTLLKTGKVHFHRPADWSDGLEIDSTFAFWVRVCPVAVATSATTPDWSGYTFAIRQPGVTVFDRAAVNGLIAQRIKGSVQAVVCADNFATDYVAASEADRASVSQLENGALIGQWDLSIAPTRPLSILKRWTGGIWGQLAIPNAGGGGSTVVGTANRFLDQGPTDQLDGYPSDLYTRFGPVTTLFRDVTPDSGGTTTSFVTSDARLQEYASHALENFLLVVTTSGGGPALGEVRQVALSGVGSGVTSFLVYPAWSAAPTTSTVFAIVKPTHLIAAKGDVAGTYGEYPIINSAAPRTLFADLNAYAPLPTNVLTSGAAVHFTVSEDTRYTLDRGRHYSFCTDPLDGKLILTNGARLLQYDGEFLRDLQAAREDDPRVEPLLGALPAVGPGNTVDPRTIAYDQGFYRQPPTGAFLASHLTHIFVAGGTGNENRVRWSAPGIYHDMWPKVNEAIVRDSEGRALTGIASYYDRLIAFTDSSIHEGIATNGTFSFRQIASGTGFTSHHAVSKIEIGGKDVLIGPSPTGLVACAGAEPQYLIDKWSLVVPAPGVDINDLKETVGVAWRQQNLYLLALRVKGSKTRNRVLVYNYKTRRAWLWSAPYGVASMIVVTAPSGEEELLIGTEDGLLMTMVESESDDGVVFSGSLLTHPITPAQASESVVLLRSNIEARVESGAQASKTVGLTIYRNEATQRWSTGNVPLGTGEATFGNGVFGTAVFGPGDFGRRVVNAPNGTRGRSFSVELTLQPRTFLRNLALEYNIEGQER